MSNALRKSQFSNRMMYATTKVAERETPCRQCTSTEPPLINVECTNCMADAKSSKGMSKSKQSCQSRTSYRMPGPSAAYSSCPSLDRLNFGSSFGHILNTPMPPVLITCRTPCSCKYGKLTAHSAAPSKSLALPVQRPFRSYVNLGSHACRSARLQRTPDLLVRGSGIGVALNVLAAIATTTS